MSRREAIELKETLLRGNLSLIDAARKRKWWAATEEGDTPTFLSLKKFVTEYIGCESSGWTISEGTARFSFEDSLKFLDAWMESFT